MRTYRKLPKVTQIGPAEGKLELGARDSQSSALSGSQTLAGIFASEGKTVPSHAHPSPSGERTFQKPGGEKGVLGRSAFYWGKYFSALSLHTPLGTRFLEAGTVAWVGWDCMASPLGH